MNLVSDQTLHIKVGVCLSVGACLSGALFRTQRQGMMTIIPKRDLSEHAEVLTRACIAWVARMAIQLM